MYSVTILFFHHFKNNRILKMQTLKLLHNCIFPQSREMATVKDKTG